MVYDNSSNISYPAQAELADFGTRLLAYIIDSLVVGVPLLILSMVFRGVNGLLPSFIVHAIYQCYFLTQRDGQTVGKRFMGIRVVKESGDPLTVGEAFVRYIGYYVDTFGLLIGWLWALWDDKRQGWHDKMAGTIVIRA